MTKPHATIETSALAFESHKIRMIEHEGEPWWALPDVAGALGLTRQAGRMFLHSPRCNPSGVKAFDASDGRQRRKTNFINERNLYAIIGQSNKPEALRFMDWVYDRVLPSIRKQGFYAATGQEDFQRMLAAFVPGRLRPWKQLFPKEFFAEMCRLNGVPFDETNCKMPRYFGLYVRDVIYDRLPWGVRQKLEEVNPKNPETGRRSRRMHQYLAKEVNDVLSERMQFLVSIARVENDWHSFMEKVDAYFPKPGSQLPLPATICLA